MAQVKYIGRKLTAVDNVANSRVTWNGNGDVQTVTDRQARILVGFADQWTLADESESILVKKEPVTAFINEDGDRVEIPESSFKKPLEHMDVNELRAYALEHYQKSFGPRMARKRLVDEIEELQRGMEPFKKI
ncbi:MAG: hypothetical protein WKF61_01110 [Luteimonas sp.]